MMNRLVTKDNYLDITKLLFNEMNKIDEALKRGYISESEIISELFDVHYNIHSKRHIYSQEKWHDILKFFQQKKFLIFNKIDLDRDDKKEYQFLNKSVDLDIIKLFKDDMYYFNSVKVATIVARTWYLKLQFGLVDDRYKVKKYTFDELLLDVKNLIKEGENENK